MRERERMGERRSARPYKTLTFTLRLNFFFAHIFSKGSKLNGDDMENVIKMFVLRLDLLRSGTRHYFSFYGWTCCDQGPDNNFRFTVGPAAIRDQIKIFVLRLDLLRSGTRQKFIVLRLDLLRSGTR